MVNRRKYSRPSYEHGSNVVLQTSASIVPENFIQILWRGRWFVLLTTILAIVIAFMYLWRATPIYTSTSRVYVEQRGPRIMTEMDEGFMTHSVNYLYTQAELIKSTPILAAVLEMPRVSQMNTFAQVDNPIAYLKKYLVATVGKNDDIIRVSFDSPFSAEAAQIVNATVDCYITHHATGKRSTATEVLKILQAEKNKHSTELSERLKTLTDFRKQHLTLTFESQNGHIILQRLETLSSALTQAQLATIEAESTYESVKEMAKDPSKLKQFVDAQRARGTYSSMGDESERELFTSKLDQLRRRRTDRLRQLTFNHPSVKALDIEIGQVEKQLVELETTFAQAQLAVAQQQYLDARDKEAKIAKQVQDQHQEVADLNEKLAEYNLLQSEWEQTKSICDTLDERIRELNVTEDVGALNISVLEAARPATAPSKPQKARVMGIGLVLGLMLGSALALLRDWMDQTLRSIEEISSVLHLPVLGVVPAMSRRLSPSLRGQRVHLEPASGEAEAFRTIRTALFFGAPKEETKTVLVTSPAPSDGKSTLVSNLGIAMAKAGQKTLILDADFRKPMQNVIFELNHHDKGISSLLAGRTKLSEAIKPTQVKGLYLLTSGLKLSNPAEILNSKRFARLLEYLSERYDRVLIDSPPVGLVTDAEILGALCHITILVLSAEKSTQKESQRARDGLLNIGARIAGTVVNAAPRKHRDYGYGGGNRFSHGYYDTKERSKNDRKTEATIAFVATRDRHKEPKNCCQGLTQTDDKPNRSQYATN